MRKIGIITIPDYNNYGNRLQNYAVKCYFEEQGFYVNTLELNDGEFIKKKERKYKLIINKYRLSFVLFILEMLKGGIFKARRYRCFKSFTDKYLNTLYYPGWEMNYLKEIGEGYDYISIGSDQVWHPTVNKTPNLFFGKFVPIQKRLFFSPSIGLTTVSDEYKRVLYDGLKDVKKISVRENAGRNILQNISDAEVFVLCDPTLIIDKDKWAEIANRPKKISDKYILSYFLGPISDEYNSLRQTIKEKLNVGIYSIADRCDKNAYATGPREFIYSIMNSDFIVTDSFHAVVFSIIFSKPFIVCSRLKEDGSNAGLDSRIDLLLDKFGLTDRKYNVNINIEEMLCELPDKTDVFEELRNEVDTYFKDII